MVICQSLQMVASISALISAYFWYRAANIKVPNTEDWNADDPQPWLTEAAKENRRAAAFAAASAFIFGIAGILEILLS